MIEEAIEATVLVKFKIKGVCTEADLRDTGWELEQMVRWLIVEEGLFGICEDDFEIISVEKIPSASQPNFFESREARQ